MADEILDYESLADSFNQALLHTLRQHSVADTFLDYWVPDADPVRGIISMVDSARIAGRAAIAVRFRRATIPQPRLPELEHAIGRFSDVAFERTADTIVLRVNNMRAPADATGEKDELPASGAGASDRRSGRGSSSAATGISRAWDSGDLPDFSDVHPRFRMALKTALTTLTHEGDSAPPAGERVRLEGRAGALRLILDVEPEGQIVRRARHIGAAKPSDRAALDLFCRAAENLPLQEVADHVGLKVIDALVDQDEAPPVAGILLPANVGAPFALGPQLARQGYAAYCRSRGKEPETNFFYAPPSTSWQKLSAEERREKVIGGVRAFLQSENLYPDDMVLLRLENNKYGHQIRAVVGFADRMKVADKPFLMRRLEQRLRRDVEGEIELIADRAKDTSPLRRLT